MSTDAFMRVRLVRLYPLYILSIALVLGATLVSHGGSRLADWSWARLLASAAAATVLLPVPGLHGSVLFPLNLMSWSLFFEIVFNWVYAATFGFLRGRALVATVAIFGAALLAADAWSGTVDWGADWPRCLLAIPRTGFSFFLGVALFRLHHDGRLPRIAIPPSILLILTLALLMLGPSRAHRSGWDAAIVFIGLPTLLCAAITKEPRRVRIYTALGEASYPAYILQAFLIGGIGSFFKYLGAGAMTIRPWGALLLIVAVMAIGWGVGVTIDPWMRRRLGTLVVGRQRQGT